MADLLGRLGEVLLLIHLQLAVLRVALLGLLVAVLAVHQLRPYALLGGLLMTFLLLRCCRF